MKSETAAQLKYGGWGVAIGAVIAMVIGFTWGGWVTGSTSQERSDEAVLASRAAICVAQFMKAPDHEEQLKAFGATDSWKRREFVEKGGWDKMPGEETARGFVSRACADGIDVLLKK
jgi:alpha/beta superfamily hydrolase